MMNLRILAPSLLLMGFFCVCTNRGCGQTNPSAQTLPYRFNFLYKPAPDVFVLPAGMKVHGFSAIQTTATTNNSTKDLTTGSGTAGGWAPEDENGISMLAAGTTYAGAWVIAVNTQNKENIEVRWRCRTISQRDSKVNSVALQYKIGSLAYKAIADAPIYSTLGTLSGDSSIIYRVLLPAECNNKTEPIYLRWVYYTNLSGGNQNRIALDDVLIQESPESLLQTSSLQPFKTTINQYASPQLLQLTASGFEQDIEVVASGDFEISLDNVSYTTSLVLPATLNNIQLWVRPILSSVKKTIAGNIRFSSWGRELLSVPLNGKVILPEPNQINSISSQEVLLENATERLALSWPPSSAEGYLVVFNDPTFIPQDGVVYDLSSTIYQISDQTIAYFDDLKVGDHYTVSIFAYNNSGSDIDYCNTLSTGNMISGTVQPVKGGISLPYSCSDMATKQTSGSFSSVWVMGHLSTSTRESDWTLMDQSGEGEISVHYPTLPLSSTAGAVSPAIPVLFKVSYNQAEGLLKASSYQWLTDGRSIADGLWEDPEGWYPGIPSKGQKIEILHSKYFDMSDNDSSLFFRYKEVLLHKEGALTIAEKSVLQTESFTLLSDRTGAGYVLNQGTISAWGVVVKHRLGSLGEWEFLSLPFDVKKRDILDFQQGDDQTTGQNNSFYLRFYDALRRAATGNSSGNWTVLPIVSDPSAVLLEKSKGYLIALDQNASTQEIVFSTSDSEFLNLQSQNLALSSPSFQGDANSIHSGWNLCGNPFVGSFDFTQLSTGEHYGNFAYYYDGSVYRLIEIGKESSWHIPFAGSFFVKALETTTLPLVRDALYNNVSTKEALSQIHLKISKEDQWDEALIRFDVQSTSGYDADKDGVKFLSSHPAVPQIAILSTDYQLALQTLPIEPHKQIVPLWLSIPSDGWYDLDIDFENEIAFESIVLVDDQQRIDLLRHPSQRLSFTKGIYNGKLNIELTRTALDSTRYPSDKATVILQSGIVYLSLPKEKALVSVFDYAGRLLYQKEHPKGIHQIEALFDQGVYLFKLTSGKNNETVKIMVQ